jgi:hypothetical protein
MKHTQKALNSLAMEINRIAAMTDERHTHMLLNDLHVDIQQIKREQLPLDMEDAKSEGLSYAYNDAADNLTSLSARIYDICSPGECNTTP